MSRTIFGALRAMHRLVDDTSSVIRSMNHHDEYTAYRPALSNTSNQNGPNWLM